MQQLTGAHADASSELVVDVSSRDELGPRHTVDVGHCEAHEVKLGSGALQPTSALLLLLA